MMRWWVGLVALVLLLPGCISVTVNAYIHNDTDGPIEVDYTLRGPDGGLLVDGNATVGPHEGLIIWEARSPPHGTYNFTVVIDDTTYARDFEVRRSEHSGLIFRWNDDGPTWSMSVV